MENWDNYVETIASLISNRENYQKLLGKVALEVRRDVNTEALKDLSKDIEERHGLSISWNTLYNYSWVEEKVGHLDIPDDLPFRARQLLAGTKNPEEWLDKVKEGMSVKELFIAIKGKPQRRSVECPSCHRIFEIPTAKEALKKAKEYVGDDIIR